MEGKIYDTLEGEDCKFSQEFVESLTKIFFEE